MNGGLIVLIISLLFGFLLFFVWSLCKSAAMADQVREEAVNRLRG